MVIFWTALLITVLAIMGEGARRTLLAVVIISGLLIGVFLEIFLAVYFEDKYLSGQSQKKN